MTFKDHYLFLFSILEKWIDEDGKPPLLLFPLSKQEFEENQAEFFSRILGDRFKSTDLSQNNPDFVFLKREKNKKNINMAETRIFIKELGLSSLGLPFKLGFVLEAEKLSRESQNALLKTMEEPHKKKFLFLISSSKFGLLPTFLSRMVAFNLKSGKENIIEEYLKKHFQNISPEDQQKILFVSGGNFSLADKMAENQTSFQAAFGLSEKIKNQTSPKRLDLVLEILKSSDFDPDIFFETFIALENITLREQLEKRDFKKSEETLSKIKKASDCFLKIKKNNSVGIDFILESFLLNL